jgi:glycosyltransferase involved in cell wall biosynthesis
MSQSGAFAVPGDLSAPTGGYHYDRQLLRALRDAGQDMVHVALPGGFPFPAPDAMATAIARLAAVPAGRVLIVDGLAFGALDTDALSRLAAPLLALVHHPLAHESGLPRAEARRLQAREQANLTRAAHVLVPSPHIAGVLAAEYGVDPGRISIIRPGRPEAGALPHGVPPDGSPLILSVGLLHPRKGHDVLIAALARLVDLPWRAVIVGAPWEPGCEAALSRQIDAAGLAGRVRLAGRLEQSELEQLYRQAHLFALATRYEGYGIVFDEALVHGLPIVSTSAGAVPGTVPEDAGTLVPPDDPVAFAGALRVLLEDREIHGARAQAALRAGSVLPGWADAAAAVGRIMARVAAGAQGG